jgi:hypothetical protein
MAAAAVAVGLVFSTTSPATAAEKEKKPAVSVECTAPCINSYEIDDGAVGPADIATDAVGADAIATGAVGADEIQDGSIGVGDLSFDPATQAELDSHVTLGNLACGEGQVAKMVGGVWSCANDNYRGANTKFRTMIDNIVLLRSREASAYVFVTSQKYYGNLGGVEGADQKCQSLAENAGLPGPYKAWIGGRADDSGPRDRFNRAKSDYILPPGESSEALEKVADSYNDVVVCQISEPHDCLDHAINVTETGRDAEETCSYDGGHCFAWTNVSHVLADPTSGSHCYDWSSRAHLLLGNTGYIFATDVNWTEDFELQCGGGFGAFPLHLYCFGQ